MIKILGKPKKFFRTTCMCGCGKEAKSNPSSIGGGNNNYWLIECILVSISDLGINQSEISALKPYNVDRFSQSYIERKIFINFIAKKLSLKIKQANITFNEKKLIGKNISKTQNEINKTYLSLAAISFAKMCKRLRVNITNELKKLLVEHQTDMKSCTNILFCFDELNLEKKFYTVVTSEKYKSLQSDKNSFSKEKGKVGLKFMIKKFKE